MGLVDAQAVLRLGGGEAVELAGQLVQFQPVAPAAEPERAGPVARPPVQVDPFGREPEVGADSVRDIVDGQFCVLLDAAQGGRHQLVQLVKVAGAG